ncbi:MAG: PDZ domain-containing protein [Pseudomonadota bacterium]
MPGTAAYEAGLKKDDVILAVNGERVTSAAVFGEKLRRNHGKEALISISRLGDLVEVPVDIRTPSIRTNFGYNVRPWTRTAPTDWSSLSAANTTARVLAYQQKQREIEAAYERGRQQAAAARSYVSTDICEGYNRYSGGSSTHVRRSANPCAGNNAPAPVGSWALQFEGAMDRMEFVDYNVMQGDSLSMFFDNYPSIYGHLYKYPAGN